MHKIKIYFIYLSTIHMINEKEILSYKGSFSAISIDRVLKELEIWSKEVQLTISLAKKIYVIAVEVLTNIHNHSTQKAFEFDTESFFEVYSETEDVVIECGNPVLNNERDQLHQRIDLLNSMENEELKKLYINKVLKADISEKGGAGLGLITIIKAARKEIIYNFKPINESSSMFTMKIRIPKI